MGREIFFIISTPRHGLADERGDASCTNNLKHIANVNHTKCNKRDRTFRSAAPVHSYLVGFHEFSNCTKLNF